MKVNFESPDGKKFVKLEQGDIFIPNYDKVFSKDVTKNGRTWSSYTLGAMIMGEEVAISITPAQAKMLEKSGNLTGKTFECFSYDTKHRSGCVGVKEKKGAFTPMPIKKPALPNDERMTQIKKQVKYWFDSGENDESIVFSCKDLFGLTDEVAKQLLGEVKNG